MKSNFFYLKKKLEKECFFSLNVTMIVHFSQFYHIELINLPHTNAKSLVINKFILKSYLEILNI